MRGLLLFLLLIPVLGFSQFGDRTQSPTSWNQKNNFQQIASKEISVPEDAIDKYSNLSHASYICAVAIPTAFHFSDFTLSQILPNGDRVYRLMIYSPDAQGLMIYLENFKLSTGCKLWLYDINQANYAGVYTAKDNYDANQNFLTSHITGNKIVVEYLEARDVATNNFIISRVYHYFRGLKASSAAAFGESPSCILNAYCSEGDAKPTARDATCRIRVTGKNFSGFCSGTLLNNTSEDKTPYILTANHCSQYSSLSDLVNWQFDFLYESSGCNNPSIEPNYISYKGCTAAAYSDTDNGERSSDFLLLKLNAALSTSTYNHTFLGWDRSNANFTNNICFHHPNGDIKKVTTSFNSTQFTSYGGIIPFTHLKVNWSATVHGFSSTSQGSSGSGLVNANGHLVGTLTAGDASCKNLGGEDLYGRFYMHWDKFGLNANQRLKPWLDPTNTGATSLRSIKLDGSVATGIQAINNQKNNLSYQRANDDFIFSLDVNGFSLTIYDMVGKKMYSQSTRDKDIAIDFSEYNRGIYWVEAIQNDTKYTTKIAW